MQYYQSYCDALAPTPTYGMQAVEGMFQPCVEIDSVLIGNMQ